MKATGLKGADVLTSKSDPYVIVQSASQEKRTAVKKGTLHPEWNERLELSGRLQDFMNSSLQLRVFDWDSNLKKAFGATDDAIGSVSVPLDWLLSDAGRDFAESLQGAPGTPLPGLFGGGNFGATRPQLRWELPRSGAGARSGVPALRPPSWLVAEQSPASEAAQLTLPHARRPPGPRSEL